MPKTENMNLEDTWKNCLAMWKWMAEQVKGKDKWGISRLKRSWMKAHGFKDIETDCFFCDWDDEGCDDCPGRLVDPDFDCRDPRYNFARDPVAFYEKLVALNKERLAQ